MNNSLGIIERQTFWSNLENKVVERTYLLNIHYLGEENNIQFYKITSNDESFKSGEMIINQNINEIIYSMNISYKDELKHSVLHKVNTPQNLWTGYSIKTKSPENNYISLEFITQ